MITADLFYTADKKGYTDYPRYKVRQFQMQN